MVSGSLPKGVNLANVASVLSGKGAAFSVSGCHEGGPSFGAQLQVPGVVGQASAPPPRYIICGILT